MAARMMVASVIEWPGTVALQVQRFMNVGARTLWRMGRLRPSERTSVCPWKGVARYYDVVVGDRVNAGAAWYYPDPKPAASQIRDHVAFWQGVTVQA